jgi:hypothetical protein
MRSIGHFPTALCFVAGGALIVAAPRLVGAQTNTDEISGVVGDSQGGVLPRAIVIVRHIETDTLIERVTDENGYCLLPSLRAGRYAIITEMPRFRRVVRSDLTVRIEASLRQARVPLGDLQSVQPREPQPAGPHLRHSEFRPHLQREEPAGDAVRHESHLLKVRCKDLTRA